MQAKSTEKARSTRTFTEEARRAQIVRAAIETFADLGYAQASFAKIAKAANLSSTGLISYHFTSKDDLVRACTEEITHHATEFMSPRIAAAEGYAAKLRAYIESNVDLMSHEPTHMRALIEILRNAKDSTGASVVDTRVATDRVQAFAEHLRKGQALGEFGQFDPQVIALSLVGAIDALVADGQQHGLDLTQSGRELADAFERATAPNSEREN